MADQPHTTRRLFIKAFPFVGAAVALPVVAQAQALTIADHLAALKAAARRADPEITSWCLHQGEWGHQVRFALLGTTDEAIRRGNPVGGLFPLCHFVHDRRGPVPEITPNRHSEQEAAYRVWLATR